MDKKSMISCNPLVIRAHTSSVIRADSSSPRGKKRKTSWGYSKAVTSQREDALKGEQKNKRNKYQWSLKAYSLIGTDPYIHSSHVLEPNFGVKH